MDTKSLVISFATTFAVALVVGVIVTFLWNLIFHGMAAVDWETSLRLAVILGIVLGIVLPLARLWEKKTKK